MSDTSSLRAVITLGSNTRTGGSLSYTCTSSNTPQGEDVCARVCVYVSSCSAYRQNPFARAYDLTIVTICCNRRVNGILDHPPELTQALLHAEQINFIPTWLIRHGIRILALSSPMNRIQWRCQRVSLRCCYWLTPGYTACMLSSMSCSQVLSTGVA